MKPQPRRFRWDRCLQLVAIPVSLAVAALPSTARAQVIWAGGTGNWSTAVQWSGNALPLTSENVTIGHGLGTGVVTLDVNPSIGQLTINGGDSLTMSNGRALTLAGAVTINSGATLVINNTSNFNSTDLIINAASLSLSGGGTLTLSNHGNNRIYGAATGNILTNVDVLIQGAGQLGFNQLGLINRGTVLANQSAGLVLNPSAAGVVNRGVLRADGGTLSITDGVITNTESSTAGVIEALNGSNVDLSSVTVTGGNFSTDATGRIRNIGSVTLDGLSVLSGSTLTLLSGTVTNLATSFSNAGTVTLNNNSNFSNSDVVITSAGLTLSGAGTLTLSNHPNNRIYGTAGTNVLTNGDNLIQGAGQFGINQLSLVNRATILANESSGLLINLAGSGNINTGTLRAAGGTLSLTDTTLANFETSTAGVIRADNSAVVINSGSVITGGIIDIVGTGQVQLASSTLNTLALTNVAAGTIRTTSGSSTLNGVTLTNPAGGQVLLDSGSLLVLAASGSYANAGNIGLNNNSNFSNTDLVLSGGTVTLAGGGTLTLSNHGNNRVYGAVSTDVLLNADHVISGAGQLGLNQMGFINRGTVIANQPTTLTINPSAAGVVNKGTLRADGGTLFLTDGTFTNTESAVAGLIEAKTGSTVDLNGATIVGGDLSTTGTGNFRNTGTATLDGTAFLTNSNFVALSGTSTQLRTSFVNAGVLSLNNNSNFSNTDLSIGSASLTLSGGGTITMSNHPNNRIIGTAGTNVLTNADNLIQGAAQIGVNQLGLINRATILANEPAGMIVNLSGTGNINTGTLKAAGGNLSLTDTILANFEATASGLIRADGSAVLVNTNSVITGGFVDVVGAGQIQLASSTLAVLTLTNSATGTLRATSGLTTLDQVVLANPVGGKFIVDNGALLKFTAGGTYANAGTLSLENSSNFTNTDFIVGGGTVDLTGGGIFNLTNHGNNRIYGAAATDILRNVDNTIQGSGQFGVNQLVLVNRGTIVANQANALTINLTGATNANSGTMKAAGGTLIINDSTLANFESSTLGLIRADNSAVVIAAGSTVTGGVVDVVGAGQVQVSSSTLSNLALTNSAAGTIRATSGLAALNQVALTNPAGGKLIVDNGALLKFTSGGTYFNAGAFSLENSSNFTNTDFIVAGGTVELTGGGTFTLANHPNNRVYGAAATDVLNNVDNTIQGSGQLGFNQMGLINRGSITANQSTALTINLSGNSNLNTGTIKASGGTLSLVDSVLANFEGATPGLIRGSGSTLQIVASAITGGNVDAVSSGELQLNGSSLTNLTLTNNSGAIIRATAGASVLDGVSLSNPVNAQLILDNGSLLRFTSSGTYTNAGSILVNNSSNFTNTDFVVSGGSVNFSGGGTMTLANHGNNRVYGAASTDVFVNEDNLIQGSGQFGLNQMGIINRGTLLANQPTTLTINPSASGIVNRGTIRANGGNIMMADGTVANSEAGTLGLIEAKNGNVVDFAGFTVNGGTMATDATGRLRDVSSLTLNAVLLQTGTTLNGLNGSVTTLVGSLDNRGVVTLENSSNFSNTDLVLAGGDVTLTGGGTISLSNHNNNRIYATSSASTLINLDNVIQGSGQFGLNQTRLINQGTIEANQSTPLTIDLVDTAPLTNQGTLRAKNGGTLSFVESLTNASTVVVLSGSAFSAPAGFTQSAGSTQIDNGTFSAGSASFQAGTYLVGAGTINGPVSHAGIIAPGANAAASGTGTLTFSGPLTLASTSLLQFEIGGPLLTEYDRLVAPTVAVNGHLAVAFTNGFELQINSAQTFTLITTTNPTGLSGLFTGLANGTVFPTADGLGFFQLNYTANSLTLSNFTAVPEPSTYLLLGLGLVSLLAIRRRRR